MARVYLARDRFLARQVAVKVLHPDVGADGRFGPRFRRQAGAVAALNHPHIVSVYDVGNDDQLHYIVMEHVEGLDLKELLLQAGPLPVRRAADIGSQIADALAYAHARGVLHRDLKPHNIMVAPSGLVKVADFGFGGLLRELRPNTDAADLQYLAPETGRGGCSPRSDIYSLGVVLYEAVTGFVPFPEDTTEAVRRARANEEPVRPGLLHTDVPEDLERIILGAMAKRPRDRPASAEELARSLHEWERTHRIVARGATPSAASRPAQVSPSPRQTAPTGWVSNCWTRFVGLLTLLGIAGIVPLTLWALNYADGGSAASPGAPAPIVVPASPAPALPATVDAPFPTAAPTLQPTPSPPAPPRPSSPALVPPVAPTPPATAPSRATPTPVAATPAPRRVLDVGGTPRPASTPP
jgi:serine/threonine-protein kinase